jgi:hypothetical protein
MAAALIAQYCPFKCLEGMHLVDIVSALQSADVYTARKQLYSFCSQITEKLAKMGYSQKVQPPLVFRVLHQAWEKLVDPHLAPEAAPSRDMLAKQEADVLQKHQQTMSQLANINALTMAGLTTPSRLLPPSYGSSRAGAAATPHAHPSSALASSRARAAATPHAHPSSALASSRAGAAATPHSHPSSAFADSHVGLPLTVGAAVRGGYPAPGETPYRANNRWAEVRFILEQKSLTRIMQKTHSKKSKREQTSAKGVELPEGSTVRCSSRNCYQSAVTVDVKAWLYGARVEVWGCARCEAHQQE